MEQTANYPKVSNKSYAQIHQKYSRNGLTYKSNEILHKIAQKYPKCYPYPILLHIITTFHYNQFQTIFFSHILSEVQPCYRQQPEIFTGDISLSCQVSIILNSLFHKGIDNVKGPNSKKQSLEYSQQQDNAKSQAFTMSQLRNIYVYLLVIGYAVKYYLNDKDCIKLYEEHIKSRHSDFFVNIFYIWANKYGNQVLSTTPRKVNHYYISECLHQTEEDNYNNNAGIEDCQYRNYNEIVEQLVKSITEVDYKHQDEVSVSKVQQQYPE